MAQIRRVTGSCTISPMVDRCSVAASLSSFAVAQASYHIRPGIQRAVSESIYAQASAITNLARTADSTDFGLTMTDSALGSLSFTGIISGGGGAIGPGQHAASVTALHVSAKLSALNLSVYPTLRSEFLYTVKGSIIERLRGITKQIMSQGAELMGLAGDQNGLRVHSSNNSAAPRWFSLLSNSRVDCGALDEIDNVDHSAALNAFLVSMLKAPTSNFLDVVQNIGSAFRFYYAPSISSGNGSLCGALYITKGSASSVEADPVGINIDAATQGALSPGAVCITGLPGELLQAAGDAQMARYGGIGLLYPESGKAPLVQMAAPGWVPRMALPPAPTLPGTSRPFRTNGLARIRTAREESVRASQELLAAVKAYARLAWLDLSRGVGTMTFTMPFTPSVVPGVSLNVASGGGGNMRGFVTQVEHVIASSPNAPAAQTSFTISHIS